ncbi:MAG: hypothetical protein DI537_12140 [Stutzerimonas stutzeri]|nr:MAG: hypothetical protein DI537_12140 [Stutzerimonas stutzeri]
MSRRAETMHGSAQTSLRRPADRHSDDEWEEAMLNDALIQSAPGPRERWFELCFRLIILVLAGLWLFVPPAGDSRLPPNVKAAATQR